MVAQYLDCRLHRPARGLVLVEEVAREQHHVGALLDGDSKDLLKGVLCVVLADRVALVQPEVCVRGQKDAYHTVGKVCRSGGRRSRTRRRLLRLCRCLGGGRHDAWRIAAIVSLTDPSLGVAAIGKRAVGEREGVLLRESQSRLLTRRTSGSIPNLNHGQNTHATLKHTTFGFNGTQVCHPGRNARRVLNRTTALMH